MIRKFNDPEKVNEMLELIKKSPPSSKNEKKDDANPEKKKNCEEEN